MVPADGSIRPQQICAHAFATCTLTSPFWKRVWKPIRTITPPLGGGSCFTLCTHDTSPDHVSISLRKWTFGAQVHTSTRMPCCCGSGRLQLPGFLPRVVVFVLQQNPTLISTEISHTSYVEYSQTVKLLSEQNNGNRVLVTHTTLIEQTTKPTV